MSPNERIALIAGATGLVGGFCLQDLLDEPVYTHIVSLVRKPTHFTHSKLTELVVNFDELAARPPVPCNDVFCTLGTTIKKAGSQEAFRKVDFGYPAALAGWAQRGGARQFVVVSSVGADKASGNFYLKTKGQMEDAIERIGFAGLHIFRPSMLIGRREESRPGERIGIAIAKAFGFLFVGPFRKYHAIRAGTVARAMVHTAAKHEPGKHIYHYDDILNA